MAKAGMELDDLRGGLRYGWALVEAAGVVVGVVGYYDFMADHDLNDGNVQLTVLVGCIVMCVASFFVGSLARADHNGRRLVGDAQAMVDTYRMAAEKAESECLGRIVEKEMQMSRLLDENEHLRTRLAVLAGGGAGEGARDGTGARPEAELEQMRRDHEREWLIRIGEARERPRQLDILRTAYRDGTYEAHGLDPDVAALFSLGMLTTGAPPTRFAKGVWSLHPRWREFIDSHPGVLG